MSEKIFIGGRIRRLRNAHGLSQTEMSKKIEISTPYLNLIESNERPLSLSVLMKLHEKFEIDIKEFTKDDSPELASQLKRVFDDPINMDTPMTRREISNLVNNFPNAASALVNIFNRYGKLHEQLSMRKFNEGTMGITESPFESCGYNFLTK